MKKIVKYFKSTLVGAVLLVACVASTFAATTQLAASAVHTATYSTDDQYKGNAGKGVVVFAKVTVVPGGDTVTFTIEGKDYDGTYYTILASTAGAGSGTRTYRVYPGATASANLIASDVLPDVWRVTVTHSGVGSFTYSIIANTLE